MPRCPKCGKEVGEEVNYCPSCGSELRIDIEALKLKLEDVRHDEKMAWGTTGLGIVFIILGAWLGLGFTATRLEWRDLTLYEITYHPYADLAIAILLLAAVLLISGSIFVAYFSYKRRRLMERLPK